MEREDLPREVFKLLQLVAPAYDVADVTTLLASRVVMDVLVSVPSNGSGKDTAPAAPTGKVYLPNPNRSSANALGTLVLNRKLGHIPPVPMEGEQRQTDD